MKRKLTDNPLTGKTTYLQNDGDKDYIVHEQQFDQLVELNKFRNDSWQKGQMRGTQKHMQEVAVIPNVVYNHLLEKLGRPHENPKGWKAWLNDSENRAFRTGGGNI